MKKYVIKAVGYNMWVERIEKNPRFEDFSIIFSLVQENALEFDDYNLAEIILTKIKRGKIENKNSYLKDIDFIIKEVK